MADRVWKSVGLGAALLAVFPAVGIAGAGFEGLKAEWCRIAEAPVAINDVGETPDGEFILGGSASVGGSRRAFYALLGKDGTLVWTHVGDSAQEIHSVGYLQDGFLLAMGPPDRIVVTDGSGNPVRLAEGGGLGILRPLSKGRWLAFRVPQTAGGRPDGLILDSQGARMAVLSQDAMLPFDALGTPDGRVIIGGHARVTGVAISDSFWIQSYSPGGSPGWKRKIAAPQGTLPVALQFLPGPDDSILFLGTALFESGLQSLYALDAAGKPGVPRYLPSNGNPLLLAGLRSAQGDLIFAGGAFTGTGGKDISRGAFKISYCDVFPELWRQTETRSVQPALAALTGHRPDSAVWYTLQSLPVDTRPTHPAAFRKVIEIRTGGFLVVGDFGDWMGRPVLAAKVSETGTLALAGRGRRDRPMGITAAILRDLLGRLRSADAATRRTAAIGYSP
ncbi:MAG TPA: hypothetical protein VJ385_21805 [Fibrobacteria bacterium]|nr:hypothetical protein [Fibrobacteria bacterium]